MKEYLQNSSDVLNALSSSELGLEQAEAEKRLERNGKNKLAEGKKESMLHRFLKQFAEPMTIILLVAALISGVMSIIEQHFPEDVIIIMAVVIINAILGVAQESKAEKAIEALQEIAKATSKVIRDGKQITEGDVFIVWMCKTLQNSKALLSTTLFDGMYYELTYNGDKKELYVDAYKKWENFAVPVATN